METPGTNANPRVQPRAMLGHKLIPGQDGLALTDAPKALRGLPKNPGEGRDRNAREGRDDAVVGVGEHEEAPQEGRYDIVAGALIWGAVFAFAAYLGKVCAENRYRKIVDRERTRQHGERE